MNLPPVIVDLAQERYDIIFVTAEIGIGKSTTLATMPDLVNCTVPKHIVTIEDPVKFLHRDE